MADTEVAPTSRIYYKFESLIPLSFWITLVSLRCSFIYFAMQSTLHFKTRKTTMSEKEEVLRQISEIKNHLVDKETFFPYNYGACHVWAVIAVVLTFSVVSINEYSIWFGAGVTFMLITVGFVVEGSLTKKVNERYDIDDCTKRQQFIMKNFLMISLFLIVVSSILATYQLYTVILLLWLFLISLGYFAVSFVLNIKAFEKMATFNMVMALAFLAVGVYFNLLEGSDSLFFTLTQAVVIFGLAVIPSAIARGKQKEEKACGV